MAMRASMYLAINIVAISRDDIIYLYTTNDDKLIKDLKGYAKTFADKPPKDYSADKIITEEKFGGIWIEDRQEFAKFVSAVNTYPSDVNGEGIANTADYFYLYYRGIDEQLIPFLSVYKNEEESQEIVKQVKAEFENVKRGNKRVKEYLNRGVNRAWAVRGENSRYNSNSNIVSSGRRNGVVGSDILRKGRYFDNPELYVKVKSTNRGGKKVTYSLKELDTPYLEAVERGDMATAERLVREAATIAMPNTKVVDKNGLPKVVYHGTSSNDTFNVFDLEDSGMIFMTSSKGIADQYTQYYCHFLASAK